MVLSCKSRPVRRAGEKRGATMTRSEKTQARKADAKYGKEGWTWADYAEDDDTRVLIHSFNCRCADCNEFD